MIIKYVPDKENILKLLLDMLTLTKSESTVEVSTCQQYIEETYGSKGILLLKNIIRALERDDGKFGTY